MASASRNSLAGACLLWRAVACALSHATDCILTLCLSGTVCNTTLEYCNVDSRSSERIYIRVALATPVCTNTSLKSTFFVAVVVVLRNDDRWRIHSAAICRMIAFCQCFRRQLLTFSLCCCSFPSRIRVACRFSRFHSTSSFHYWHFARFCCSGIDSHHNRQ